MFHIMVIGTYFIGSDIIPDEKDSEKNHKALQKLGVEPELATKDPDRVLVEQKVEISAQVPAEEEVEVPVKTE